MSLRISDFVRGTGRENKGWWWWWCGGVCMPSCQDCAHTLLRLVLSLPPFSLASLYFRSKLFFISLSWNHKFHPPKNEEKNFSRLRKKQIPTTTTPSPKSTKGRAPPRKLLPFTLPHPPTSHLRNQDLRWLPRPCLPCTQHPRTNKQNTPPHHRPPSFT